VKDQSGKERVAAGAVMTDKEMGVMDFYVEGIQGQLPKKQ
jgi:simple sugar transport system substrate-binding protein